MLMEIGAYLPLACSTCSPHSRPPFCKNWEVVSCLSLYGGRGCCCRLMSHVSLRSTWLLLLLDAELLRLAVACWRSMVSNYSLCSTTTKRRICPAGWCLLAVVTPLASSYSVCRPVFPH